MSLRLAGPGRRAFWLCAALALGGCVQPLAVAPVPPAAVTTPPPAPVVAPARPATVADHRNAFVLLSGGGTPLTNNYSQYLQARAVATYFERRYPADATWVFFGIGNREGETPLLADARQQVKRDGLILESWLPGPLRRNRPATRDSFLKALREEILPTVRDGGTLYLFVGDHGTISRGDKPESLVTMWQLKENTPGAGNWATDNKEILSVTDLQTALAEGLGKGRVVFCMTQCHSGGFHYLGVPREIAPPAAWLNAPPAFSANEAPAPLVRAAGFTATDEESLAAGCDPDPDPDKWAGYERFVPENLLGLDLFTLEPAGGATRSFAEAHTAATLVDRTIDKPRSTSEQYLERWAQTIEKLAASPGKLTPAAAQAVRGFQAAVDTGRIAAPDAALREKAAVYERFIARLTEQNTAAKELLLTGLRKQLEEAAGPATTRPGAPSSRPPRGTAEDVRKAWREVVRPAWKTAVLAGEVQAPAGAALAFEKRLLDLEENGQRDFMLSTGRGSPMLNELYWRSGYAYPARLDRAKAEAVTQWGAERRRKIVEWAKASADEKIRAAGEKIAAPGANRAPVRAPTAAATAAAAGAGATRTANVSTRPLSRRTAAERVLFYRRTLAAWEFLVAMNERSALEQLAALMELEQTPLP